MAAKPTASALALAHDAEWTGEFEIAPDMRTIGEGLGRVEAERDAELAAQSRAERESQARTMAKERSRLERENSAAPGAETAIDNSAEVLRGPHPGAGIDAPGHENPEYGSLKIGPVAVQSERSAVWRWATSAAFGIVMLLAVGMLMWQDKWDSKGQPRIARQPSATEPAPALEFNEFSLRLRLDPRNSESPSAASEGSAPDTR